MILQLSANILLGLATLFAFGYVALALYFYFLVLFGKQDKQVGYQSPQIKENERR